MNQAKAKAQFLAAHLRQGEEYAGLILGKNGEPDYHLFLLPGQVEGVSWEKAKDWAANQGGALPTPREQSLLFANLPDAFDKSWYWSCQQHETATAYAWAQSFRSGGQSHYRKTGELRARAVRRLVLE